MDKTPASRPLLVFGIATTACTVLSVGVLAIEWTGQVVVHALLRKSMHGAMS